MSWQVNNIRRLSSGGYGELWLAKRSDTGELVVVKYLLRADPVSMEFFRREVCILQKRTTGLVEYLGSNMTAARPFYVMTYYDRGSLAAYAGKLSHAQLRSVAKQLAETISGLHAAGVAHGDVKPDNILVTGQGSVRVGDPLGKGSGCTIMYGVERGGTPGYWAPEVAAGGPMSVAADVFSYGATLFHLATGRRPQDGQRFDPRTIGVAAPKDIAHLINVCCRTAATERPHLARVVDWFAAKNVEREPVVNDAPLGTIAAGVAVLGAVLIVKLLDS